MTVVATRPRGSFAMARFAALVAAVTVIVVLIIAAGILLHVYWPHTSGTAVSWTHHASSWLTGPFHGVINSHGDRRIWLNWGLAAVIYLIGGMAISSIMRARA